MVYLSKRILKELIKSLNSLEKAEIGQLVLDLTRKQENYIKNNYLTITKLE